VRRAQRGHHHRDHLLRLARGMGIHGACGERANGRQGFSPLSNPTYGWGYIVWQVILWTAVNTCWQTTAMRTMSMKSPELSKKVFGWTGLIFLGRGMLPMLWGIAAL